MGSVAILIIFCIISFHLAFKKTLQLYFECCKLQHNMHVGDSDQKELTSIRSKLGQLDSLSNPEHISSSLVHQQLLDIAAESSTSGLISLKEFPAALSLKKSGYLVETHIITAEGDFSGLLRFTNALEKNVPSKVVSSEFKVRYDPRQKKKILSEKIYIQMIKKEKND